MRPNVGVVSCLLEVGLALRTLLATVDETIPVLPASTHREVGPHPGQRVGPGAAVTALLGVTLASAPVRDSEDQPPILGPAWGEWRPCL